MTELHDRTLRFLLGVSAAVLCAAAVLAAQSGPPRVQDPPQPPIFRAEANFVRVDVYPTADGQPVMDLTAEDFTVLEDGVAQTVATFEHVIIQTGGPQTARIEPSTIEASRQAAANPRNRVFVLFLDTHHVSIDGTWHSREPLIQMVDSILGDDDLVGIMTPDMSAADVVLARKTEVLASGLRAKNPWGERHRLVRHPREEMYRKCYPWLETEEVVKEMAARRHERTTLDAVNELVHYLAGIREDRKAIVMVTEGWLLYRPNPDLARPRVLSSGQREPLPAGPDVRIGPDGRLRLGGADPRGFNVADKLECDRDRVYLSQMNNWDYLREIMDDANRWNASFYTIDPRGLPVFDEPIGPDPPPPPHVSFANVTARHDTMRTLADNTDGLAVLNSNDLDAGLKRISDDLTSYYLLGYYSTNTKYDGGFRTLDVRVTRPGVEVRARRGYRAATEEEVRNARAVAAPVVSAAVADVQSAIGGLARLRSDTPFRVHAVPDIVAEGVADGVSRVWVAGELRSGGGGSAAIQVTGGASGSANVTLAAGQRAFLTPVDLDRPVSAGVLDVRVRFAGDGMPQSDVARVDVAAPGALLFRRGPSTGNRVQPAGDVQFSRTERARLEVPLAEGQAPGEGRVLDRNGEPLAVPVAVGERTDEATGQRWLTADITLAPLGTGDYAVELFVVLGAGGDARRVLTAIRVTR